MRVAGVRTAARCCRLRQRYRHARVRYGRHGSASSVSACGAGGRVEPVRAHRRVAHPEVTRRQHVGPVQREHQEHVRGPLADPLDGGELADDLARRGARAAGRGRARRTRSARPASAGRRTFACEKPAADAQLLGVVGEDLLGRRRRAVEALEKPRPDRRGGLHRQLLAGDRRARARRTLGGRPRQSGSSGSGPPKSSISRAITGSARWRWASGASTAPEPITV